MTRTLRGSLLIASMLVVAWATSSEACHRRRASRPRRCYSGLLRGVLPTRAPRATTARGGGYATAGGGYYGGGYAGGTAGYPGGGYGRLPARVRLRPARLQPGRPRRAGVRAGGAARPGRRRLRPGALTVHRFSDHPAGASRPGPTG